MKWGHGKYAKAIQGDFRCSRYKSQQNLYEIWTGEEKIMYDQWVNQYCFIECSTNTNYSNSYNFIHASNPENEKKKNKNTIFIQNCGNFKMEYINSNNENIGMCKRCIAFFGVHQIECVVQSEYGCSGSENVLYRQNGELNNLDGSITRVCDGATIQTNQSTIQREKKTITNRRRGTRTNKAKNKEMWLNRT